MKELSVLAISLKLLLKSRRIAWEHRFRQLSCRRTKHHYHFLRYLVTEMKGKLQVMHMAPDNLRPNCQPMNSTDHARCLVKIESSENQHLVGREAEEIKKAGCSIQGLWLNSCRLNQKLEAAEMSQSRQRRKPRKSWSETSQLISLVMTFTNNVCKVALCSKKTWLNSRSHFNKD